MKRIAELHLGKSLALINAQGHRIAIGARVVEQRAAGRLQCAVWRHANAGRGYAGSVVSRGPGNAPEWRIAGVYLFVSTSYFVALFQIPADFSASGRLRYCARRPCKTTASEIPSARSRASLAISPFPAQFANSRSGQPHREAR
jgi:hypothetical protein